MLTLLVALGVIFLIMFAFFLFYIVYMGSCHVDSIQSLATSTKDVATTLKQASRPLADLSEKTTNAPPAAPVATNPAGASSPPATKGVVASRPKASNPTGPPGARTKAPISHEVVATKSPIMTIANKSLTSIKSLSSNKSIDTGTSNAMSTRSSLEVQRKEIALKKKKRKATTKEPTGPARSP